MSDYRVGYCEGVRLVKMEMNFDHPYKFMLLSSTLHYHCKGFRFLNDQPSIEHTMGLIDGLMAAWKKLA